MAFLWILSCFALMGTAFSECQGWGARWAWEGGAEEEVPELRGAPAIRPHWG